MSKFTLVIFSLCLSANICGQQITKEQKLERIKAQKMAFITNKLNLSSAEAQHFWPVYNDFFKNKELLNREKKQVTIELQDNWKNYSEDKKTQLVDDLISFRLKEAQLEQKFHEKFKTVLSIDKVIKLYNAENQFKTYLLRQIKEQNRTDINSKRRDFQRK